MTTLTATEIRAAARDTAKRTALEEIKTRTAYSLARDADCASPDNSTSVGADFLGKVADSVAELLADAESPSLHELATEDGHYASDVDDDGSVHEIADAAVPIYTHTLWTTFTDLAAYQEDPSELGYNAASDMGKLAGVCLYIIAQRLAFTLIETAMDTYAETYHDLVADLPDEDDDEDEG